MTRELSLMFLQVNRRTADDYAQAISPAKTFSLSGSNFDAQARQALDLDEWLRVMAYQQLVNPADVYYTGVNIHNFRLYVRPEDRKVLYLPWDWDSVLRLPANRFGRQYRQTISNQHHRRLYLNHMFDIINTTFNTNYMAPWATHYGAVASQDVSDILSDIYFGPHRAEPASHQRHLRHHQQQRKQLDKQLDYYHCRHCAHPSEDHRSERRSYPVTWISMTN
jgi:hypothetical protein